MNPLSIALMLLASSYNSSSLHANETVTRANETAPTLTAATAAVETPSAEEPATNPQKYGPTTPGETLAHVVQQVLTDATISNEQMMWALYTTNPKAFEKGKLSKLRAGIYLTVPSPEQVRKVDQKVAHREIESRTTVVRPTAKPKSQAATPSKTGDLDAQIEEAKRERDDAAKEQMFLKARLKEMEDKIQTLLRENADRDAKLRAQSAPHK
ncbi:MAG: hypothetical protein HY273_13565 [Gammaproteobacteria bacterium]|nr:hypothetical protein [Gammaproteobacteria bacterium]